MPSFPMPSSCHRGAASVLVIGSLLIGVAHVFFVPSAAWGHTQVRATSPAPGEEVGAGVDELQVSFLDPVQDGVEVDVRASAGSVRTSAVVERIDSTTVRASFDPLPPGTYRVDIAFASLDGDQQVDAFQFDVVDDDGGRRGGGSVAVALAMVAVLGFAGVIRRYRTPRQ